MMDAGLLSLKWNNHVTTFFHVLETIRKKELYSDVTIACDGKYFSVHKLVLSTCSDYFLEIFEKTQCKHPIIVLKDINANDFECLLNYMYVGEVNVLQNDLSNLIKAAECLKVKGLAVPDEPPSSKKSNKRSSTCDREDVGTSSKRNKRNGHTSSEENIISSATEKRQEYDNFSSSNYQEPILPSIKEERVDPLPEEPSSLDINSGIKLEKCEEENADANLHSQFANNTGSFFSNQHEAGVLETTARSNIPSTSGYDDSSNWSGDIETIDDDDDGVGDGGNYDPNIYLDPSQVDAQMDFSFIDQSQLASPLDVSPNIAKFLRKKDALWACVYEGCSYQHTSKSQMIHHIRVHTGEKPYTCHLCQYRSAQRGNLQRHIISIHVAKKGFPCPSSAQ